MQDFKPIRIIVASRDPKLADVRKAVLERAGFTVVAASDSETVEKTCTDGKVGLVMIGYSVPPSEKRRIWRAAREKCQAPILELYRKGAPEIVEQHVYHHQSETPEDFLDLVMTLTSRTAS
jgi:DNA-binding response OmpR family regulator